MQGTDRSRHLDLPTLERALRAEVDGEVRFDAGSRGAYATDGSNYRQVPLGVVVPRTTEAGAAAVGVCSRFAAPVLLRGGGTSLGGQCTNEAVVIDWTKHCNRLLSVDPQARTCVVEPGIVLDELNRQLAPYALMFGPKPSTHSHCSLDGLIGNNSCGATAQAYGKTVDNIGRLEVLTYAGTRFWAGPANEEEFTRIVAEGGPTAHLYQGLRDIAGRHLAEIRRGYPKIPRRVSGCVRPPTTPWAGSRCGHNPSSSPTDSAAAPRSTRPPPDAKPCTWPKFSPWPSKDRRLLNTPNRRYSARHRARRAP
ncbi:hypothetical protein GCM10015535_35390 [Streptomyces gelaticus]|uniref:FAD-binding PCMH-type domain-containing protein n=1 Tax=Streptomyces gelaticus TaxID=285446 RepID=A0ABQ2W1K6_9ACTN|nr:hypothetical protein GCM10015535_35390 [Streptomyces gelaticus]